MARTQPPPSEPTLYDWALLATIVAFGGSAFAMVRGAVETMPFALVAVGRIWIGAILLFAVMRQAGRRLPPLLVLAKNKIHIRRSWQSMIAVGVIGNTMPFLIFPWAQQYVESGLAGVYMAFMPIWTLGMAYFFAGEAINNRKIIGFIMGLAGVIILMGPDALRGALSADMRAQSGLLLATFLYATAVIVTRRAPPIRPRVFAAGMMIAAAISVTPALLLASWAPENWSFSSIASVIGLGILPTAVNGVLIIMLVRRAGAGFMALTNYVTPLWAVAMGALIFGERLPPSVFLALFIILVGVAISQRSLKPVNYNDSD